MKYEDLIEKFILNCENFWDEEFILDIDSKHKNILKTFNEIYKDNIIFGSGIKTFRLECSKEEYSKIKSAKSDIRCSTHPHNIYFEIISETGSLGVLFFLLLFIFFIKDTKLFSRENLTKNPEIPVLIFIYFWPIQSTGSFFFNLEWFFLSINNFLYLLYF